MDFTKEQKDEMALRVLVESLKSCPLCEALVAMNESECFACGWHGKFDQNSEPISESLALLNQRCPELIDAMMVEAESRMSVWTKFRMVVRKTSARLFTSGVVPHVRNA